MHINIILSISLLSTSAIGLVIPADDILEARASTSQSTKGNTPKGTKPPTGPFVFTPAHQQMADERYRNTANLPDPGSMYHIKGGSAGPSVKFTGEQVHGAVQQALETSYKPVSQQREEGFRKFGNKDHKWPLNPNEPRPFPQQQGKIMEGRISTALDRHGNPALGPDGRPIVGPARVQMTKKTDQYGNEVDHLLGVTSHVRDLPPGLHETYPYGTSGMNDHHVASPYPPSGNTYQHQPGIHGGLRPAFDDYGKNYNRPRPPPPVGYNPGNPTSGPDIGSSSRNPQVDLSRPPKHNPPPFNYATLTRPQTPSGSGGQVNGSTSKGKRRK